MTCCNWLREINSEIVLRAGRRVFSSATKRRILEAVDRCAQPGEVGALLRREGVYSSSLSTWRRQPEEASNTALAPRKQGPQGGPARADAVLIAQLTRDNQRLQVSRLITALSVTTFRWMPCNGRLFRKRCLRTTNPLKIVARFDCIRRLDSAL